MENYKIHLDLDTLSSALKIIKDEIHFQLCDGGFVKISQSEFIDMILDFATDTVNELCQCITHEDNVNFSTDFDFDVPAGIIADFFGNIFVKLSDVNSRIPKEIRAYLKGIFSVTTSTSSAKSESTSLEK